MRHRSPCLPFVVVVALFAFVAHENDETKYGYSSSDYYKMIEHVSRNIDYYQLLELDTHDPSPSQVKKAFRKLSLIWHPDKNTSPEAAEKYQLLAFAQSVLSKPQKRELYDNYRLNGLPWVENYYGKYAHRYGAPDHDIRTVLAWTILVITVVHYLYRLRRYHIIMSYFKTTPQYRNAQKSLLLKNQAENNTGRRRSSKKKGKNKPSETTEEPEIKLIGVSKPGFRDLFVVQLVLLPWTISYFFYSLGKEIFWYGLLKRERPDFDRAEYIKQKYNLTDEEYEEDNKKFQNKVERYMKKRRRR